MNKGLMFAGGMVLGGAIGAGVGALALLNAELKSDTIRKALTQDIAARLCRSLNIPAKPRVNYRKPRVTYRTYHARHSYAETTVTCSLATETCRQYWFPSRQAANEAIAHLNELITTYGYAACADFYEWVGLDACDIGFWTTRYGWSAPLKEIYVSYNSTHDVFAINFPRCCYLELPKEDDDDE